jgi:hypothetical protein
MIGVFALLKKQQTKYSNIGPIVMKIYKNKLLNIGVEKNMESKVNFR